MSTSIHVPPALLEAVDRRAAAEGISRNRFIVRVLERVLADNRAWSPGFFESLQRIQPGDAEEIDRMLEHITDSRRSKGPPAL